MAWLLLLLSAVNAFFSFIANYVIHFSALDIAPIATIIIARNGGNIWITALVLVLAYSIVSVKDLAYIWIELPMCIVIGYLSLYIESVALLLLLYHVVGLGSSLLFGYFSGKYVGFFAINYTINYALGKILFFLV